MSWKGRCFKVECSHGDARPSWWIYRRVVAETSTLVECVRIESRSDNSDVLYLGEAITKAMLGAQTEIDAEEFNRARMRLEDAVSALPEAISGTLSD